ncbi:maleylpyruvate isomerase family mycothiol-dependent enzyme [Pseudonocardia ailaonensis]|uniref:Maleylpyruvate isomerase family mycothiol-dependent enzyme n=1 Tax=Pseudonocardia ailaonensis TaxID=367279 RepID=A0ABN2N8R9_9PSEU
MTDTLVSLIHTERAALADDLAGLTDAQWAAPSLCDGWCVEEVVAHLTSAATMTPARWIRSMLLAGFRPAVHNRRRTAEHRGATPAATLARFREVSASTTAPSGHTAAWLGEVVVHGQDARRALGLASGPSVGSATEVARFFVSRNFAVPSARNAAGLRLEATDGPFTAGAGPIVRGSTEALVLAMAGRPAVLPDLTGDGVAVLRARIGGPGPGPAQSSAG